MDKSSLVNLLKNFQDIFNPFVLNVLSHLSGCHSFFFNQNWTKNFASDFKNGSDQGLYYKNFVSAINRAPLPTNPKCKLLRFLKYKFLQKEEGASF
jgi:hypothetical protein